ncbi:MAG: hypothetical protein F4X97_15945 [Boseongicola sp. SB0662_bin_57]|nr:hypothetical protein [Boseongicola sp. SB0662_bin_57]
MEKHKLDQQLLIAQQAVNSAETNAEAKRLEADAEAYRVLTEAQAEAHAIRLINERLGRSTLYVDLVRAKRWDGFCPRPFSVKALAPSCPCRALKARHRQTTRNDGQAACSGKMPRFLNQANKNVETVGKATNLVRKSQGSLVPAAKEP